MDTLGPFPASLDLLEPVFGRFEPCGPRLAWVLCLRRGTGGVHSGVNTGPKPVTNDCFKSGPGPFGSVKRPFLGHCGPVLTRFDPFPAIFVQFSPISTGLWDRDGVQHSPTTGKNDHSEK